MMKVIFKIVTGKKAEYYKERPYEEFIIYTEKINFLTLCGSTLFMAFSGGGGISLFFFNREKAEKAMQKIRTTFEETHTILTLDGIRATFRATY